jgi:hypothetical protein
MVRENSQYKLKQEIFASIPEENESKIIDPSPNPYGNSHALL